MRAVVLTTNAALGDCRTPNTAPRTPSQRALLRMWSGGCGDLVKKAQVNVPGQATANAVGNRSYHSSLAQRRHRRHVECTHAAHEISRIGCERSSASTTRI